MFVKRCMAVLLAALMTFSFKSGEKIEIPTEPVYFGQSGSVASDSRFQEEINRIAEKYGAIGAQVALIENGEITGSYAYGWATVDKTPMTTDHKLRIASISKVILGMEVMNLVDKGIVDLDEQVGKYFGTSIVNPNFPDVPITVKSILVHNSSIKHPETSDIAGSYSEVKAHLSKSESYLKVQPGSSRAYVYNNYAFGVLGMAMEKAAGQRMQDLLEADFIGPLDIDLSYGGKDLKHPELIADCYKKNGEIGRSAERIASLTPGKNAASTGAYFAGGVVTNAYDLAKLICVLANDGEYDGIRVMSEEAVERFETYPSKQYYGGYHQALVLRHQNDMYGRKNIFYHTGSAYGMYCAFSYDPDTRDGVVVLTDGASATRDSYTVYAVCGDIMNYLYGEICDDVETK